MSELYLEGFTQNRELSWLKFNERVLNEAANIENPLLERLKFSIIYENNLTEFIKVRIGSLNNLKRVDSVTRDSMSGLTSGEQIHFIWQEIRRINDKFEAIIAQLYDDLQDIGVRCGQHKELSEEDYDFVDGQFLMKLSSKIKPHFLDRDDMAEIIKDGHTYIFVETDVDNNRKLMLIEIPKSLLNGVVIKNEKGINLLLPIELVKLYLKEICFPFEPKSFIAFRAFRNADIDFEYEEFELGATARERIKKILDKRVSSEFVGAFAYLEARGERLIKELADILTLSTEEVVRCSDLSSVNHLAYLKDNLSSQIIAEHSYNEFVPAKSSHKATRSVIDYVMERDLLDAYPYDSMDNLLELLREAATHSKVKEIKISIYRMTSHPRIFEYLIKAASQGKHVRVLIELRARFDEANNVDWASKLEEAGCEVYYGTKRYKSHFKICQVVFKKSFSKIGEREIITQVGTGNYNETTARQYTDFSVITAKRVLGQEISRLFESAVNGVIDEQFRYIITSPGSMRKVLIERIDNECKKGTAGRIFIKVNSVSDREIIEKLAEASQSGVKIRMIVRGICTLLPGVDGYTDNIEIISIIGRFLEHSRVYIFGSGDQEEVFISSADIMNRNMDKRFELAFPITDESCIVKLKHIMHLNMMDNVRAKFLLYDGRYVNIAPRRIVLDSQEKLLAEFGDLK
ncbi:polyphosphate kinase 1 [Mogibacterium pumilum]|uniref:Polyphosphate kinase n=1 Tax=Mogibacterium pumilum TaxID=86332 RepID=A0A223ASZ4_9FIRM|nr:polyphosphate kinase 1 [Mogibacterium pumilum]ASS38097.1 polyphosphate kinase 1 [Mogibacterium pumilum]